MSDGFYNIGYGLAGGFKRDREIEGQRLALQKEDLNLRKAEFYKQGIGLDEKGQAFAIPGGDFERIQQQNKMLTEELMTVQKQLVGSQTFQLIDDFTHNRANATDLNRYINSDAKIKQFFTDLGLDHVVDINFTDTEHLDTIAKAIGESKFSQYMADNQFSEEEQADIRRNFVLASDGKSLSLNAVQNMLKVTGASQYNFSQERLNQLTDNIKKAQTTLTSKMIKYKEDEAKLTVQALEQNIEANKQNIEASRIKNETDAITLELYMEARNNGLSYEDIFKKSKKENSGYSQVANTIEYLRDNYGDDAADAYLKKQIEGQAPAEVKVKEYNRQEYTDFLSREKLTTISQAKYQDLSQEGKRYIDETAKEEMKAVGVKLDDINELSKFYTQSSRLDTEGLEKAIGPIDHTSMVLQNLFGINIDPDKVRNSAGWSAMTNTLIKSAFGTAVSGNEMSRMVGQVGKLSQGDKNVMIQLSGMVDDMLSTVNDYKVNAPALYVKNFKLAHKNLKNLKTELDKYADNKGATDKEVIKSKPKVVKVKDSAGKVTEVKLGGHYKGEDGKTYQLTGIKNGTPSWKEVTR